MEIPPKYSIILIYFDIKRVWKHKQRSDLMANYDYKKGLARINNILNDQNDIEEKDKVPVDSSFTYHNGYYAWVTAFF